MIISIFSSIKVSNQTLKWYRNKGYVCKKGDLIEVKVEDLTKESTAIILVKCDNKDCSFTRELSLNAYNIRYKKGNSYYCLSCVKIKKIKTNLDKYGVEWAMQIEDTKDKVKNTNINKYGVSNVSQTEQVKVKKLTKSLDVYGTISPLLNSEIIKKTKYTLSQKYGVKNISQVDIIKEKKKITTLKNLGVENPLQSLEIFNKSQKNGKYLIQYKDTKSYYRGSYELDFLEHCENNKVEVVNGWSINYIFEGKSCVYFPDFYYEKLKMFIEIKSSYYYNLYLEKNLMKKMYTELEGYTFLFIIDKNYSEFNSLLNIL